jgi:hypothetical protein
MVKVGLGAILRPFWHPQSKDVVLILLNTICKEAVQFLIGRHWHKANEPVAMGSTRSLEEILCGVYQFSGVSLFFFVLFQC